jgi:hypothetical protein
MKFTYNDDGSIDAYVRQSWINDAMMCNERGRQGIVRSEWSMPNDATILGTAVHAGIAAILEGKGDGIKHGLEELNKLFEEPFIRVKYSNEEMYDHVHELVKEWEKNIAPSLGNVVGIEKSFSFLLDEMTVDDKTIRVHGIGTVDCVTDTDLWDWKTSGKKYSVRDKQSQAVQPTMYATAAVELGWLSSWPVSFKYGVLVRSGAAQIVEVHRNESHADWLRDIVRPFVRSAMLLGTEETWPKNDTHYLCSSTWCSWWSVCKGSKLSPSDIQPKEGK